MRQISQTYLMVMCHQLSGQPRLIDLLNHMLNLCACSFADMQIMHRASWEFFFFAKAPQTTASYSHSTQTNYLSSFFFPDWNMTQVESARLPTIFQQKCGKLNPLSISAKI